MTPHEKLFRLGDVDEVPDPLCHPAEVFCAEVLRGVDRDEFGRHCQEGVAAAFLGAWSQMPYTAKECQRELEFWEELGSLRSPSHPTTTAGISRPAQARVTFLLRQMRTGAIR